MDIKIYLCFIGVVFSVQQVQAVYENVQVSELVHCPGLYCGRVALSSGNWSECGPCPRGYRANTTTSECEKCLNRLIFYDWLYLGWMGMLSLLLHWVCIDMTAKRRGLTTGVLALHISALLESVAAALITLLLFEPMGRLDVDSCSVERLSDWYTMLHNPTPDYYVTLHCTQEAVYPLYVSLLKSLF